MQRMSGAWAYMVEAKLRASSSRKLNALDVIFLVLTGLYLASMVYSMSMFPWDIPKKAKIVLLAFLMLVGGCRVLLIGVKNPKVWIGAVLCAVYCCVFYVVRSSYFLFLAVCTIGFLEMDYYKIIRTYLIAVGIALTVIVIAALIGAIENLVFLKDGHLRYSMGTIYPTDFASLVLFLLVYLWSVLKRAPDWVTLFLPVITFAVSWKIAYSVTSMVCSALFAAIILYYLFHQRILAKHPRMCLISDWLIRLAVAFFACTSVLLLFAYARGGELTEKLDIVSNRFYIANLGKETYGLHPFGSNFELIGYGKVHLGKELVNGYNFIDNSYLLSLIRYGYVFLIAVVILHVFCVSKLQKADNRRLALVLALIAFHSISEHHLIELHYNISLALPLAAFARPDTEFPKEKKQGEETNV